jgi:hypothetical protein
MMTHFRSHGHDFDTIRTLTVCGRMKGVEDCHMQITSHSQCTGDHNMLSNSWLSSQVHRLIKVYGKLRMNYWHEAPPWKDLIFALNQAMTKTIFAHTCTRKHGLHQENVDFFRN